MAYSYEYPRPTGAAEAKQNQDGDPFLRPTLGLERLQMPDWAEENHKKDRAERKRIEEEKKQRSESGHSQTVVVYEATT